jgi:GT2 family glycosyltransferase
MKLKTKPIVSVIVLSHNRPHYLNGVLDSIMAQSYRSLEVIVVDNKSPASDEIAELVRGYRGVRLIRNSDNPGYTGGMNRGLAEATGDYIYFTVDDVLLESDCIEQLVEYDLAHPAQGLLAGILLAEDRRTIICAGGEFALRQIYHRRNIGAGEEDVGQFTQPFEASCVDGAMVFSRLQFMRAMGGFREEFFIYSDSIELSARVLKAGGRITIVPQARAYVYDPPHVFTEEGISFHKIKNLYTMYLLHARWRVLPEFFLRYGLIVPLRSMCANRKMAWPLVKAWAWFLFRAPSLLQERARGTSDGALAAEDHSRP